MPTDNVSTNSLGTVVWLDDDPNEDRVRVHRAALSALGYKVVMARGFRELDWKLRERIPSIVSISSPERVVAIVLDIMIEGVSNLANYFPWVHDAKTSSGFAAGLVFLERVLYPPRRSAEDKVFGHFDSVPVIVYSIRAVLAPELARLEDIRKRHKAGVGVLVKETENEFINCLNRMVNQDSDIKPA